MKQTEKYTKSGARLQLLKTVPQADDNWVFVPGGPGLGSESLRDLFDLLALPGTMWAFDFPGDGSNTTADNTESFSHWSQSLVEVVDALTNVIIVAHSSGGMFTLATPALGARLKGLVLMDSAPNASWQDAFAKYMAGYPLPEIARLQALYEANPSNSLLKQLTIACVPYFSMNESHERIIALFETLPFNYESHIWAANHFDPIYKALWVPETIPTLILAGDQDHLTPLKLFSAAKKFKRDNIVIREIYNASHFPWIENPEKIKQIFADYCACINKKS